MRTKRTWPPLALAAALATSGCGGESALGQASFSPECAPTDVQCVSLGFGAPVAAGGTVSLRVSSYFRGSTVPSFDLVSANPAVLRVEGTELTGVAPGTSAVLLTVPPTVASPPGP